MQPRRYWRRHWLILRAAWYSVQPSDVFRLFICAVQSARFVSPRALFASTDVYVTTSFLLFVLIFINAHHLDPWSTAIAIVSAWRVADLFAHHFGVLFVDRYRPRWTPHSKERIIIFSFVSFGEILLAFATLYLIVGDVRLGGINGDLLVSRTDALYYSTVTMTTLGYGDFVPGDRATRQLVVAQLLVAITYVSLVLQAFVGLDVPSRKYE